MEIIRKQIKLIMKKLENYQELREDFELDESEEVVDCLEESLSINRSLLIYVRELENEIEEMKK